MKSIKKEESFSDFINSKYSNSVLGFSQSNFNKLNSKKLEHVIKNKKNSESFKILRDHSKFTSLS